MSANPVNNKTQLVEIVKTVSAILGVPLALFAVTNSVIEQPLISLVVAIIAAVLISVWVVLSGWANITQIITAWLALAVVVLAIFVVWPRTMTVEGRISNTAGNPVSNEKVILFDLSNRVYETKTDAGGYYQFTQVPAGKYRLQVRSSEVEGQTRGILVRVVQQNLAIPGGLAEVVSTPAPTLPTDTPKPTSPLPTNTPVPAPDTPTPQPPTDTPVPEPIETPTRQPSDTPTNTRVPPTSTFTPTRTPVSPTSTSSPTNTRVPPTSTFTPTRTPVSRTSTATSTSTRTPTPSLSIPSSPVEIRSLSGTCMDVPHGVSEDANLIQVYPCHGGPNQKWIFTSDGEIRDSGGKCLDVRDWQTDNGALVQLYTCHGGQNQRWTFTEEGEIRGLGAKCLDTSRGEWKGEYSTQELYGIPVQLYECNGGDAQKWSIHE